MVESYLVADPEDTFSRDVAQIVNKPEVDKQKTSIICTCIQPSEIQHTSDTVTSRVFKFGTSTCYNLDIMCDRKDETLSVFHCNSCPYSLKFRFSQVLQVRIIS